MDYDKFDGDGVTSEEECPMQYPQAITSFKDHSNVSVCFPYREKYGSTLNKIVKATQRL